MSQEQKAKRRKIEEDESSSSCFFPHLRGFEPDFIRMIIWKLPLDAVLTLRSTIRLWRQVIDSYQMYWNVMGNALAPLLMPATPTQAIFFSLYGIKDAHLRSMYRLFCSTQPTHRYMVRRILSSFLNLPCVCLVQVTPASESQHPAAQSDPFSFCLKVTFPGLQYPQGVYQFFCVEGQTILWRPDYPKFAWNSVSPTQLVANYRQSIQFNVVVDV
jgi:hypothetical protein